MSDLISRQAAIDAISSMFAPTPTQKDMVEDCLEIIDNLPSAQPKATLLHATKIVLDFIEACDGTTAWLITPDGDRLSCDWGYVEDGLHELIRYAERREVCDIKENRWI